MGSLQACIDYTYHKLSPYGSQILFNNSKTLTLDRSTRVACVDRFSDSVFINPSSPPPSPSLSPGGKLKLLWNLFQIYTKRNQRKSVLTVIN
jgi:hypothetical protein